ncbi:hydrolase [Mycolicibacter terrae]|uniref:Hydrolase n=1 Tax=Mycolicibacter terrae TaxID=1788 RepID=A0AAD1HXI1_9MYCO|nr:MBL fold metallo-hydrolase [Mycolicibacter terrae]ORW96853.1 hydrolase [Mycolicibacter terrae]BBX22473.1 hydrolase [Mycolicibacter terrae]SNV75080.1 Metallo-beta-lactamase superfamily [Mycolicibacter terrae]
MFWLCRTCGVEHDATPEVCTICADERQWVPAEGQQWATLEELAAEGVRSTVAVLEPGLIALGSTPPLGIGQLGKLVCTAGGNVLWDPSGFLDDAAVAAVTEHGPLVGIVASHPHMFGAQVQWSRRLGGVPVYVNAADAQWVMRPDPVISYWSDRLRLTPTLTAVQVGGHFPGSAVACWEDGADGRGVLLVGDTIFPNPDRRTVAFLRSYPNRIPLSAAVVQRMADTLAGLRFDRIYGLLANTIDTGGAAAVRFSADRHAAWVRGDYDDLT